MSIRNPDVYSYKDTQRITIYGEALVSQGLQVRLVPDGFGLLTRGLVWELEQIWGDIQLMAPLSTSWAAASGASITTTWAAASGASVSTTWANIATPS